MDDTAKATLETGRTVIREVINSNLPAAAPGNAEPGIKEALKNTADIVDKTMDIGSKAIESSVSSASSSAFENAASIGTSFSGAESSFSWSGYFQAIGILCLLLAALWFGTWLIRRYGKFNFLPRPGAIPKDSLVMEAQMPLGPKKGLMVVRFFEKRLLLGITEHQITLLSEETAHNERQNNNFQNLLANHAANSDHMSN